MLKKSYLLFLANLGERIKEDMGIIHSLSVNFSHSDFFSETAAGAAVAEWLSSWLAEQEDRGSIPGLAT